ncbi:Nn.00g028490.m01.CDS01 [Neocucurbitaria sp. VM-36]
MAHNLPPLPQPGLTVYQGFTARKPETFLMKGRDLWSSKASFLISHSTPTGEAGAPFLEIREKKRKQISFLTMDGKEVMRIVKQPHNFHGTEYHGMRGDGNEVWYLKLHSGMTKTDYLMTINDPAASGHNIQIQNKIQGQDKGILMDGTPVATMSRHEAWSHMSRHDLVHVAPGMDILLALGVNWIRADKQKQDAKAAAAAS